MKASPSSQKALLEMQDCDMQLARLTFTARSLPVHEELEQAGKARDDLTRQAANLQSREVALQSELQRIERDLVKAQARQSKQSERLEAGLGDLRELRTMQEELSTLSTRIQNLEEEMLGAEEELEKVRSELAENRATMEAVDQQLSELKARRQREVEQLRAEAEPLQRRRAAAMAEAGTELTAEYDAIRKNTGGFAVLAVSGSQVLNHNLTLTALEREKIRLAAPDQVLVLDDSGFIVVRTD